MGAFVSAFLLYGIALLYGQTGSTRLTTIAAALAGDAGGSPLAVLGLLLVIAAFGFKMSLVPFHAWSPDTYQGAPSPFVGFLSVAPKAASAIVLIRVLITIAEKNRRRLQGAARIISTLIGCPVVLFDAVHELRDHGRNC